MTDAAPREGLRAKQQPCGNTWQSIETAPKDGLLVWTFTASLGPPHIIGWLPCFEGPCTWHPDAGFCTDELRTVTHWDPETTKILRDAARYRWLKANNQMNDDVYRYAQGDPDGLIDAEIVRENVGG